MLMEFLHNYIRCRRQPQRKVPEATHEGEAGFASDCTNLLLYCNVLVVAIFITFVGSRKGQGLTYYIDHSHESIQMHPIRQIRRGNC